MKNDSFFDESSDQSRVKAAIVAEYFWAWARVILPVVKAKGGRIAYIDLFAGPGRYGDDTKSTPILVLEKAIGDPDICQRLEVIFNDFNLENANRLQAEINQLKGVEKLRYRPRIYKEEVGEKIVAMFADWENVPTLFFVDPWGYKGLSLGLVNSVLRNWGCDCIFFFNYNRINPGLMNPFVKQHMDMLFGCERAEQLRLKVEMLSPREREVAIVEELSQALRQLGAPYVLPFCFKNESGKRTSHHLIFATKHPKGYEIMKGIMAKYSSELHQGVPSFGYCPATELQPFLFELNRPLDDLEEMLVKEFRGQALSVGEIYNLHNVGRPYIRKNYKDVLRGMEERKAISANPSRDHRRPNTMGDQTVITFKSAQ
ncbi:MAG TPA: three-Cys-motif partner protein TcmP [Terracidiphilus sp.]|nr:three-Cys-motif partner protein TcmP [Terracidiphilus sp.]